VTRIGKVVTKLLTAVRPLRRMSDMRSATPLPASGEAFLDARGDGRALRVTWHPEADVVVLSLWRERTCAGTFRLAAEDIPTLVELLRASLEDAYDDARTSFLAGFGAAEDEVVG
jgi:hypothetical protein